MASLRPLYIRIASFVSILLIFSCAYQPPAHAAVGTLPGNFTVDASGAANYEIPIKVAPGISGIQPELSLSYNSRSGNGTLGVGWSITGLSAIHRCSSNLAQDGLFRGIEFNSNDRFCLDGQRLILVNGTYGAPNAEYRTELDGFTKIVSEGTAGSGPQQFRFWSKSGQVLEYGVTADSRIEAQGRSDVMIWAINRISDSKENYVTFSYEEDNTNGEYRIDTMHYTGNSTLNPEASIIFEYETRPDVRPYYVGGSKIQQSQRLLAIHTDIGVTEFKSYHFTYETAGQGSNVQSFLDSIQECAEATECLSATDLSWYHPTSGDQFSSAINTGWGSSGSLLLDVNGDGREDLIKAYVPIMTNGISVDVMLSTGSGFGSPQGWGGGYYNPEHHGGWSWNAGDVNGDGKADLVLRIGSGTNLYLSNGSSFQYASSVGGSAGSFIADMNGDGRGDLVKLENYQDWDGWHYGPRLSVRLSTGSGFGGESVWYSWGNPRNRRDPPPPWSFGQGDMDGDGKTDIVFTMWGSTTLHRSTGNGFASPINVSGVNSINLNRLIDMNGDGLGDLFSNNGVHISNGLSFDSANGPAISGIAGDVDGNGLVDVYSGSYLYLLQKSEPDHITSITNGLSHSTSITYKSLKNSSTYTSDGTGGFPNRHLLPVDNYWVVSEWLTDNGISGQSTTTYQYGGAKTNLHGRGFLGFSWMEMTNTDTGIVSRTEFRQDFPFTGMVERTTTSLNGVTLSETTNSNFVDTTTANGLVHFPQAVTSTTIERELDGTEVKRTTSESVYDDYGNPTSIVVTTTDGNQTFVKTTSNIYTNDTTNWFLGRLTRASVTHHDGISTDITRTSAFEYEPATGLLSREIIEPDSTIESTRLDTVYQRDGHGNINAKVSCDTSYVPSTECLPQVGNRFARSSFTNYDYTNLSINGTYTVTTTNGLNHQEVKVIDARFGVVKSLAGPNGLTTTWDYDGFGRKTDEYRADGTNTHIERAWCDTVTCPGVQYAKYKVTTTSSGKPPVTVYYDKLNRELRKETVGFNGTAVYINTAYDALGRIDTVTNPYFSGSTPTSTSYQYDAIGRVIQETAPGNRITKKRYFGLVTEVEDARNHTTRRTKDALGRLIRVTDAKLNDTHYGYDAVGNLTTVTDALGNQTLIEYDIRGRKSRMTDPDMGFWKYSYNAFGDLTWQKDAKGQETYLQFDPLGRLYRRTEGEGATLWIFDEAANGIGKLYQVTSPGGITRTHTYDTLGRPQSVATSFDGSTYTHTTGYDSFSRPDSHTYPEGFQVSQSYNAQGYLEKVFDPANPTTPYWQANAANARGQITQETLGNGLVTTRTFQADTGYLHEIGTGTSASYWNVQSLSFVFDEVGNLKQRADDMQSAPGGGSLTEMFDYDELNRLTSATIAGVGSIGYDYDAIGNLINKSDVSAADYVYDDGTGRPHAVKSAGGITYSYDANGSMTGGGGRTLGYTSFNKPNSIAKGTTGLTFLYGADRARVKQVRTDSNGTQTTYYVGLFEKVVKSSVTVYRHTITAGGRRVGVYTQRSNGNNDTRYLHTDHQGSLNAITDATGNVVERFSFDAFGRVRQTNWTYDPVGNLMSNVTTRGYTGHEQLNDVGLIHMNGRVYDPTLGRFASADPFIQAAANPQSLNRYSYVLNNPLSYTDPSGFFFKKLFKKLKRGISKLVSNVKKVIKPIAAIAVGVFAPYVGMSPWAAGFLAGYIGSGGNLKAGIVGAFSAGIANWVGHGLGLEGFGKHLAHGFSQGTIAELGGGEFRSGFWGSFLGSATPIPSDFGGTGPGGVFARTMAAAVVGGTASVLGGGKFANGARSAAFVRLFNDEFFRNKGTPTNKFPDKEIVVDEYRRDRYVGLLDFNGPPPPSQYDVLIKDNSPNAVLSSARRSIAGGVVLELSDALVQKHYVDTIQIIEVYAHRNYTISQGIYDPASNQTSLVGTSLPREGFVFERRDFRVSTEFSRLRLRP